MLKSASKPTAGGRKRQKIPILGTYGEYSDSKSKAMAASADDGKPEAQSQIPSGSSIMNYMAPAPQMKDAKMAKK